MKRILLADDDPDLRSLLTDELAGAGFEVYPVTDGVEAVIAASERRFDLFLLDMLMPRMHGRATIRVLRKIAPRTPIIAITGYVEQGYMNEAVAEGVMCLAKPIKVEMLLQEIAKALEKQ